MNIAAENQGPAADEMADLRANLAEAMDTLHAIRHGEVDGVLVQGALGDQLFTLKGADDPYRVLIEEMNQGALTLAADGSILYCNRRFADLLGLPLEKIIGVALAGFVAPAERARFAALFTAGHTGRSAEEITLQAADGSAVPLQLALAPLPPEASAAICLIATDISESRAKEARLRHTMAELVGAEQAAKAARAEAERANAAKSEFLANMSHEIRTPMNGIIGMTDLALETELDGDQRSYLGMVKSSAHSLLGLINNFLDFSKIEAGKMELELIGFSLRACLTSLCGPLIIRAEQKNVALITQIAPDVPDSLLGDPMRLRQILLNLLDNAIKFATGGEVRLRVAIEAAAGEPMLYFTVANAGLGIPPEKQKLIFEPFEQADASTTRTHGGTGLGLAIAADLVRQMGGRIWVESAVNQTTAFHFTARLPRQRTPSSEEPPESVPAPAAAPLERPAHSLRILLVEDNVINRALATSLLEKRGHSLVQAGDGREAVAAARGEAFDLILMDVQMPGMDGFEATRLIRQFEQASGRHTPVAAMTARAMAGDRERCLAAGMDDYISKPLEKAGLLTLLERISADPRPGRGAAAASPEISPPPELGARIGPVNPGMARRCLLIARASGLCAILVGLTVSGGWLFSVQFLLTVLPGFVSMKVNTALGLGATGLSLFLSTLPAHARARKLSGWCAGAVVLIGALTLAEFAIGWNLGIDQLLSRDDTGGGPGSWVPGRMAPITAFNFVCVGSAAALLPFPKRAPLVHALAGCVAFTSLLALVGYFYEVASLYQTGQATAVALHTAVTFLVLCAGLWSATSRYGFMALVTSSGSSGMLMRRYGLAAAVSPFVFGWLRLEGQRHGWYGVDFGVAVFSVAKAATLFGLLWIGASSLQAAERQQAQVQESLRQAQQELEQRVQQRTRDLATANEHLQKQMLARSKVEYANQQILDNSLDVICTFDADGRFLQVNRASEAVWGYRPEELIGREFMDLVHPDDRQDTTTADAAILEGTPATNFENRYIRRDGSVVAMLWTANWSATQQVNFCVARDMTARKEVEWALLRAKEAAESANRAKSEFLANMSHEIRTPMNGIMGMTDLVLDTPLDHDQREYLGMAKSSADALLILINDILDFSKIEAGKLALEAISFSLRDCCGTMLKPLGMRADQKGLELTSDIAAEVPDHLIGDPMRLRQILINLIDNAIKFTSRGDVRLRVTAEAETDGEQLLHFCVADTGIGILPEKQALIFEAFAQADGSTTRHYGGTGLGLAIATQLVSQMNGRMWVESIVGEGTAFHFTARFPVRHTPAPAGIVPAEAAANLPPVPPAAKGLRILLAEDNLINHALATSILKKRGHSLVHVEDGHQAVAAALRETFDLILMDLQMPGLDGFEATRLIRLSERTSGHRTPIAAMTARAMSGDRERCLEAGMDDYISKPLRRADLLDLLDRISTDRDGSQAPSREPSPPVLPAFTREKLLDQVDGDEAALAGMIALFHQNTPRLLADIRGSITRCGGAELAFSAHALLSSLGVFGAHRARQLAQQLEAEAQEGDYERIGHTFAALEQETAGIHLALSAYTSPGTAPREI